MALKAMTTMVRGVESTIDYKFKDPLIAWEALQAAKPEAHLAGNRHIPPDGNKRLAVLGDSILRLALVDEWYSGGETRGNEVK